LNLAKIIDKTNSKYNFYVLLSVVIVFLLLAITGISWDHQNLVIFGIRLPQMCLLGRWVKFGCPFCGLTRSLWCCIHGHWQGAYYFNYLGYILFLGLAIQIPIRIYLLFFDKREIQTKRIDSILCETFLFLALARWISIMVMYILKFNLR